MVITAWIAVVVAAAGFCAAAPAGQGAALTVRADRADGLYKTGETATFLVQLAGAPATAEADCELSTDGFTHSERSRIALADGKAGVTATRDFPCVLWIRVTCPGVDGKPVQAVGGCAFSPEKIEPSMPAPDDFGAFWTEQKARLDAVPPNPKLEPLPSPDPQVEVFSLTLDNVGGTKVYAQLARPKGNGPFPAFLIEQWSGVYSLEPRWVIARAQQGFLALNVSPHAIENLQPPEYYRALSEGALKDYAHQGRDSRDTYYFLRVFLGCRRVAEYLASRPDWDGKHLIVFGDSQGAGLAIVTAALSPHVTAVMAAVPAMCDHTAMVVGREPGWPRLVSISGGKPDPVQLQVARYFDVVNFAREVKAPALLATTFTDLTCPASGVYAAYNVLGGPKELALDPTAAHSGGKPNWEKLSAAFLAAHSKD